MRKGQSDLLKCEKWRVESGIVSNAALNKCCSDSNCKNSTFHFQLSTFKGFTLAEVLITLAVIGVVAAVTMPVLMTNINERVNSERQANIVYKITQAMEHMRALGKLTAYDSTESFVDELQKHLKIQKRCDSEHIAECWPTDKVTTTTGKEIDIADVTTSERLGFKNRTIATNNVGLILADGASIILNYDVNTAKAYDIGDKVEASSIGLPVGNNKSRVFQYTTSVTAPVSFVMDVNGKKGPNSETIDGKYHDIRSFNGAKMDNGCAGDKYGNTCVYYIGTSYSPFDCSNSDNANYRFCKGTYASGYTEDYWAGARLKCASISGMTLPTVSQLQILSENRNKYPNIKSISGYYWSSEELPNNPGYGARNVNIENGSSGSNYKSYPCPIICVNESFGQ